MKVLQPIEQYYTAKLREHGESARGVDWNGEESQVLRFRQLERLLAGGESFSVNDLGCGYGALFAHLDASYKTFTYRGIDVSAEMVAAARRRYGSDPRASFQVGDACDQTADYSMASGIFNVRVAIDDAHWLAHILAALDGLDRASRRGFAFNCLTSYSDPEKRRPHLYYADPCAIFDHCKRRYAKDVALLHDYGLYEFTILVRKGA